MRLHYNKEEDSLEIAVGKTTKGYSIQIAPGIFVKRDEKTDEIQSIEIKKFKDRYKDLQEKDLGIPIKLSLS